MMAQGMHLSDLVRALGWSYATLWSMPNLNSKIVWMDGTFEVDKLKTHDAEYWSVEMMFNAAYKSSSFALGSGYVGKVLKEGQPLWLNGIDVLMHNSNTSRQAHFFKVAGIQTLLCIPWYNSVVELGSSIFLQHDPSKILQIQNFLSHITPAKQPLQEKTYFPLDGSLLTQDISAESDDASFNGGLDREQQLETCSSYPRQFSQAEVPRPVQDRVAVAEHNCLSEEVVAGSRESDWRLEFATSAAMLQKRLTDLRSPRRTLRQDELRQGEVDMDGAGAEFDSALLNFSRQLSNLSQLQNDQSISTSHSRSSSKGDDDTNHLMSISNGNSHNEQCSLRQDRNSSYSRNSTATPGFIPWSATAHTSSPRKVQKGIRGPNQVVLQRSISMTHRIPQLNASRDEQRAAQNIAVVTRRSVSTAEEVLSGHDEAAVHHMLAERKRRQKQKDNFSALRSLIPFVSKMDRASILGDAITYVKQLAARVEELESLNRELEAQLPHHQRKRCRASTIASL